MNRKIVFIASALALAAGQATAEMHSTAPDSMASHHAGMGAMSMQGYMSHMTGGAPAQPMAQMSTQHAEMERIISIEDLAERQKQFQQHVQSMHGSMPMMGDGHMGSSVVKACTSSRGSQGHMGHGSMMGGSGYKGHGSMMGGSGYKGHGSMTSGSCHKGGSGHKDHTSMMGGDGYKGHGSMMGGHSYKGHGSKMGGHGSRHGSGNSMDNGLILGSMLGQMQQRMADMQEQLNAMQSMLENPQSDN